MYQSSSMYGQAAYGHAPHPFSPPPVNAYYGHGHHHNQYSQHQPTPHQVPQPPPVFHVDPNTFRRDYAQSLSELTFNSRPIIQNLSMLAQDYSRYADIVVSCLEDHIRRVHPSVKLPAFYLLDAISKNVHEPYARRFSPVVSRLFLDTYRQVDEPTRQKMEEMLLTWRTGAPNRAELFGSVNQIAIERGVWGDRGNDASLTKAQVLSELQFAIDLKRRTLQANPTDTDSQHKIDVMQQLKRIVQGPGVTQDELQQITKQLREFIKAPVPPPPVPVPQPLPQNNWNGAGYPTRPLAPQAPPVSYQNDRYPPTAYSAPPPAAPPIPQPSTSTLPPVLDTAKLSNIINNLVSAGVIPSSTSTPPPALPVAPTAAAPTNVEASSSSNAEDDAFRSYRTALLSQKSILSSTDILRTRPMVKTFLYDRLPSQCKQCGLRFSDSTLGKKQHQAHLDMHFQHNRKAAQSAGRGHSRTSFLATDDWVGNVSSSDKGKAPAHPSMPSEGDLRKQFVVVPPGDEAKNISCPICKEHMKCEFLEDDEEWVWRNAVLRDDKIYHATCHAEAMSSTNTLASRLRSDLFSPSRGATPERSPSRSTPPPNNLRFNSQSPSPDSKVGMKRKVEDTEAESHESSTENPPVKKLAT